MVISTRFNEPWYTYSQDFKVLLMELGCTVYNPNTDNAETYGKARDFSSARARTANMKI